MDILSIFAGMTPAQTVILIVFVFLTGVFSINFALVRRTFREFIDAVDDAAQDGQYTADEIAVILTKGRAFLTAVTPAITSIWTAIKAFFGGFQVPSFLSARKCHPQGDPNITVAIDVLPKGSAKVGQVVTVADINHNVESVYFGDGTRWIWEKGDTPYIATHVYTKAGVYEIQAVSGSSFAVVTLTVTGDSDPTPTPTPTPTSIWTMFGQWVVSILKAIFRIQ